MKNFVRPLVALALMTVVGAGAHALDASYGNESYAAQTNYDSFNLSVMKRMETLRIGSVSNSFGSRRYNTASLFGSDEAYAMAPSSRTGSTYSGSYSSRRQLDCVYYSGFTVWADLYQTWAKQRNSGGDGYKHRVFGPMIGFDWTSGGVSVGAAMTYGWGRLTGKNVSNKRDANTFALTGYAQYNTDQFYINGTIGYGHTSFDSERRWSGLKFSDDYASNSFNLNAEFGYKFVWNGLQVIPNAGLRYFHDRRGGINEGNGFGAIRASTRNYHVVELPLAVDVNYEIATNGMVFVPRAKFGWTPELSRKRGAYNGTVLTGAGWVNASHNAARRSRHGFNLGLGFESRITSNLSAHVDYNLYFRSRQHEHHWNLGMGFSF